MIIVGNTKTVFQTIINNNALLTGETEYVTELEAHHHDFDEKQKEN